MTTKPETSSQQTTQNTAEAWVNDAKLSSKKPYKLDHDRLDRMAAQATSLGMEIVEIAGFLDDVDKKTRAQAKLLTGIQHGTGRIESANEAATQAAETVSTAADETRRIVEESVEFVRISGGRSRGVSAWVSGMGDDLAEVMNALRASEKGLAEITDIAREVNILAINASIEANRVGEAGKGFGIIASAIGELSQKTASVTRRMDGNVESLKQNLMQIAAASGKYGKDAAMVIDESEATDLALSRIARRAQKMEEVSAHIKDESSEVRATVENVLPNISEIDQDVQRTASQISNVRGRANDLIDRSESLVQLAVALGGNSDDAAFIDRVKQDAAEIGRRMEAALDAGRIGGEALFSEDYQPIPGTNPEQVRAPFTDLTDQICPEIQEAALGFSERVVFCAAVDYNGYLPTHNMKFSEPQGTDPVWNAANCRNRRIFDDRVGLKAGRSTAPFLLQVYRRDMGGGHYTMMKDLSAPIYVKGQHWGGLRLAYTF